MDSADFRHHTTGPVVSINTPFLRNDDLDYQGLRNLIEFTIDAGVRTILYTPGDSLYAVLTEAEIAELTAFTARVIDKRAMFIAGAGIWSTRQAAAFGRYASEAGADAMIVAPAERQMTVEELVTYYRTVSDTIPCFILSAGLASVGLQGALKTVEILVDKVPGIVGMKEDFGPEFIRKACLITHGKWALFAGGQKQTHMDMLPYGCDGYMSTFAKFKPDIAHAYWSAIEDNDLNKAVGVIERYDMPLFEYLYSAFPAGGDAGQHALLELFGICGRWRRKPLPDLTGEDMEKLKAYLIESSLL